MRRTFDFRGFIKPTIVGLILLSFFSCVFVLAYIFTDYKFYVTDYKNTQAMEVESVKNKTETTLKNLEKLLQLTGARIQATEGDVKRLQGVIGSLLHSYSPHNIPEFHKVSYTKLSSPRMVITRLGVIPFETNEILIQEASSRNGDPFFSFDEKGILGKIAIWSSKGVLEGLLEVQIDSYTLHNFLGSYETLDLVSQLPSRDRLQNLAAGTLVPVYGKAPESFQTYIIERSSYYSIFLIFTLFMAILTVLYLNFTKLSLQSNFRKKIEDLNIGLTEAQNAERSLKEELLRHQLDIQSHQVSCQSQRKFHAHLNTRQQEQARQIAQCLDVVCQSLESTSIQLSYVEMVDILQESCKEVRALGNGVWTPLRKEAVDLKAIVENLQKLFAEKIHKSHVMIETNFASISTSFMGDPLLMESLLLNVIGKSIHRVPKNGTVSITLKESPGLLNLEVQDNGFSGVEISKKLIKKSFDLFMDEETFRQTYLENGLVYKCSKADSGLNITNLIIPIYPEEESDTNVVKLFK